MVLCQIIFPCHSHSWYHSSFLTLCAASYSSFKSKPIQYVTQIIGLCQIIFPCHSNSWKKSMAKIVLFLVTLFAAHYSSIKSTPIRVRNTNNCFVSNIFPISFTFSFRFTHKDINATIHPVASPHILFRRSRVVGGRLFNVPSWSCRKSDGQALLWI